MHYAEIRSLSHKEFLAVLLECIREALRGPPEGKDVSPGQNDTPDKDNDDKDLSLESVGCQPLPSGGWRSPIFMSARPPLMGDSEPNIVVFGHLHRATKVFLCQTIKDASALWGTLPRPHTYAVIALPDPQDLRSLIIPED